MDCSLTQTGYLSELLFLFWIIFVSSLVAAIQSIFNRIWVRIQVESRQASILSSISECFPWVNNCLRNLKSLLQKKSFENQFDQFGPSSFLRWIVQCSRDTKLAKAELLISDQFLSRCSKLPSQSKYQSHKNYSSWTKKEVII